MYPEVEWAVPADPYIVEELAAYDGWHTAKNLEINTEFSRQWISQRCPVLADHGLVTRHPSEPAYRLTAHGRELLEGDIDAVELDGN